VLGPVAIVSVELPDPLIDEEENDAVAPLGNPPTLRPTLEAKPPTEVTDTLYPAFAPAVTV